VDNLTDETNSHGTNYQVVLQHTDKIVIWGYYDLDEYDPSYFVKIGQFLQQFGMGRVIMSLGLWDEKYPVSPADKFAKALQAVQDGGVYNIWITPGSLMTPDHWKVLQEMWAHP
jgi:hypothetical protein